MGENKGFMLVKELKPLVIRWISSGDLMYSKVTILLYFISMLSFHAVRRAPKNWCFWTVAFKKTPESPLDCKEIQPVHPKGNQSWIFIGRTDAEAEAPILWPPDVKNWLTGKDPDAGKDWRQEEKGTTEDEMVVPLMSKLNGHEFGWILGVGDVQGSLACCSPWGCKESDTTEWLNWTELNWTEVCCLLGICQ